MNRREKWKNFFRRYCHQIWLLCAVLSLPVLFCGQTLLLGRPLIRDDAALQFYPQFAQYAECLRQNDLYLWDPHQWCGLPALGTAQSGGFYPFHLIAFRLLPWQTAIHFCYWLHFVLALGGFIWLARSWGADWGPAFTGGAIYAFSGFAAAHLIHYNFVTSLAHFVLILAFLQAAWTHKTKRFWGALSAEIALAFLSMQPQLFLMALFMAFLWLIIEGWRQEMRRDAPPYPSLHRNLVYTAFSCVLAFVLVLPQFLSELELTRLVSATAGQTGEQTRSFMSSYPFRVVDIPRIVFPNLYGSVHNSVMGSGPAFHETSVFVGIATLTLAAAGIVLTYRRRGFAFILTALLVGIFLIPVNNPLYSLLIHIPVLNNFRCMGRWALLPIFSLAMLVSLGLTALPVAPPQKQKRAGLAASFVASLVLLILVLLWLTFGQGEQGIAVPGSGRPVTAETLADVIYNWLTGWEPLLVLWGAALAGASLWLSHRRRVSWTLAFLAAFVPLWHYWQSVNQPGPALYYAAAWPPATAQAILKNGGGRLTTLPPELVGVDMKKAQKRKNLVGSAQNKMEIDISRELLTPVLGLCYGLSYADGYRHRLSTPATYQIWQQYFHYGVQAFTGQIRSSAETIAIFGTPTERMKRLHQLCGIQFIVTPGEIEDPDLELIHEGPVRVYRYRKPHPQAWLVRRAHFVPDPQAQLIAVKQRNFRPDQEAVVDAPLPSLSSKKAGINKAVEGPFLGAQPRDVVAVHRRFNETIVHVNAKAPALLVMADAYYPGWKAYLDGKPSPIMRANFAFRAVAVPAGEHEIVFRYEPSYWRPGVALMLLGCVLLLFLLL